MVKVRELFDVQRGSCAAIDAYEAGNTPLVSASTYNQGIVGFVSAASERLFPPGSISVAVIGDGSSCYACVRTEPFHATINTEVLTPKMPMERARLMAIASVLRASKWRFHYGRIVGGRLADLEFDESLIDEIAAQVTTSTPTPSKVTADVMVGVLAKLRHLYGVDPRIEDVFEIKQGRATSIADLRETGKVPVVSATEKEVNAVAGYIDRSDVDLMPAGSISVAKDGKPCVARVQSTPYRATEHALCLVPKADWNSDELLSLAAIIERQTWRFSFARAASAGRLAQLNLLDGLDRVVAAAAASHSWTS